MFGLLLGIFSPIPCYFCYNSEHKTKGNIFKISSCKRTKNSGVDLGGEGRGCAPSPGVTCGFLIKLIFWDEKKLCGLLALK